MKLVRLLLAIVVVVSLTPVIHGEEGVSGRARIELALRDYAKLMCSAVFISARDLPEAQRDSGPLVTENIGSSYSVFTEADRARAQVHIDRKRKVVATTFRDFAPGMARFYGDQGCVILPRGVENAFFTPKKVSTRLPPANTQSWPMGNVSPRQPRPDGIDQVKLQSVVDRVFSDPAGQTLAFVVVYKGQILAERYGRGANKDTLIEGWSMGKSLLAALIGVLIKNGEFGLYDPAPVPEWQRPGDPRSNIRIADLLRMSGGLHFTAPRDPDFSADVYPDHVYVYNGAVNIFEFAFARPLQFPPNTEGRYRNCDPLTLGFILQQTVKKHGEDYFSFPQRALLDRIGIRRMVLETDPYGNMFFTGNNYTTARNWARLGLLYLQDGVWSGERILPEGFVDFVRTPAPAWKQPIYGGLFWLNATGQWNLPKDAYYMSGEGGKVFIVPSLDLVVVRMGHEGGQEIGLKQLNVALGELAAILKPSDSRSEPPK
jgi:CubicO group peptidase (beta-lactamase class C family)